MKPDPRENDVDTSNRTEPSPYLVHSAHWQHTLALELGTRHSCARYTGDSDRALYYAWCFVIEGICITSTRLPLNLLRSASTGSTTIPTVGAPSFMKFCSTFHKCPSTYNLVTLRGWRWPYGGDGAPPARPAVSRPAEQHSGFSVRPPRWGTLLYGASSPSICRFVFDDDDDDDEPASRFAQAVPPSPRSSSSTAPIRCCCLRA